MSLADEAERPHTDDERPVVYKTECYISLNEMKANDQIDFTRSIKDADNEEVLYFTQMFYEFHHGNSSNASAYTIEELAGYLTEQGVTCLEDVATIECEAIEEATKGLILINRPFDTQEISELERQIDISASKMVLTHTKTYSKRRGN